MPDSKSTCNEITDLNSTSSIESRLGPQVHLQELTPRKSLESIALRLNSEMNRGFLPGPLGVIAPAAAQRA